MKSKTALIRGGIFFCVAGALSGCATNSMTRSGFLGDYEKLSPTRYENVLMYRAAGFEPKRYAAVVVEEAQIKTASGRIDGLDDAQQREVLDHVTSELKRQEGKSPAPPGGAGQVRVRVAVTELQTPNRAVNAMTTLLVGPVTTGGASLEFEAVDALLPPVASSAATSLKSSPVRTHCWVMPKRRSRTASSASTALGGTRSHEQRFTGLAPAGCHGRR